MNLLKNTHRHGGGTAVGSVRLPGAAKHSWLLQRHHNHAHCSFPTTQSGTKLQAGRQRMAGRGGPEPETSGREQTALLSLDMGPARGPQGPVMKSQLHSTAEALVPVPVGPDYK